MQKPAPPAPATLDLRAAAILTVCCGIWGVGLVMVKIANTGISPLLNAGLRSVFAGTILFAWCRWRGISLFARDATLAAGMFCGVLFAFEFIYLYVGLQLSPASRGTILLHCAPFVAAYGEHLFVPGHRLTRLKVAGLVAAFVGLVIAFSEGLAASGGASLKGDLYCLLGGVFWGATTVVVRATALKAAPAEKTLLYQLAVSAVVLLVASPLIGEAGVIALTPKVLGAFAYTVLLVVVIGYTTWFWMMRTYSAASLHAFTFLSPIFGVIAAHLILGEPITPAVLAGLTLVALGIYLVNRPSAQS
jgi:drug/metabolite transporter (DMT)-like permease